MPQFHTLWVTKVGAQYLEEAQEFATQEFAAREALHNLPKNDGDEEADDRIFFKDIDGQMIMLRASRVDHAVIIPAEKVDLKELKNGA